jgi:hypothetical protein
MNTGKYDRIISIQTKSESESSGDITETWGAAVSVRARVTQVDGTRYLEQGELIDRAVYKLELWDNSYSDNIKITYGSIVMYPIRPITRNPGTSFLNEIVILAATKK